MPASDDSPNERTRTEPDMTEQTPVPVKSLVPPVAMPVPCTKNDEGSWI